jgi:hypothetical protein
MEEEEKEEEEKEKEEKEAAVEENGEETSWMSPLTAGFEWYRRVHARSRSATRWCSSRDELSAWERGECLRALVYSCPLGPDAIPQEF